MIWIPDNRLVSTPKRIAKAEAFEDAVRKMSVEARAEVSVQPPTDARTA